MLDGRRDEDWSHTASIMALTYNMLRHQRQPALTPRDFHPFHQEPPKPATLKELFGDTQETK